jgi:hypothetical protein
MKRFIIVTAAILSLSASGFAIAAPYASKVKITSGTSPIGQVFIKAAKVPDASAVGIPAYPGGVILQTRQKGAMKTDAGKAYLPYIKLLTPDSVDKVVAWYKAKLPRYFYQKKGFFGMNSYRFWKVKGDYGMMDMDAMGTIENVIISDGTQHADVYPKVSTMIEITYEPKTRK